MKKKYRLKKNKEITLLVSKRKYLTSSNFVMYYLPNEYGNVRLCVSVSKKVGNAVVRNKVKRQIKDIVYRNFDLNLPVDILIIVRVKYLEDTYQENANKIIKLYNRLLGELK